MKLKDLFKSQKRYYIPGVDQLNQLEETPASKARTELRRFVITAVIAIIAAVAAIVAAVVSVMTYISI